MPSSDIKILVDQVCSNLKIKYTEEQRELIINTYLERGSLSGMQPLFGVAPNTDGLDKKSKQQETE